MADRRYEDDRRGQDERRRRDPEEERRGERRAEMYRGPDERGYGGGERLGRRERSERGSRYAERPSRDRDFDPRASPSGAFHEDKSRMGPERGRYGMGSRGYREAPEHRERDHSHLAGLHDMDDMSELREGYREHRRQRDDYPPRYGHGPGVENMDAPRLGYGTSTTRGDDHDMGHGGFLGGGNYRSGSPMPTGRGPKGYQRSDERIREDICDRLMMGWMNAENVDVEVRNGEVTLKGMVKSRDEKRAIEALAESVLGVKDLINMLRVERTDPLRASERPEPHGDKLAVAQDSEKGPMHS
ncbi:BON domain-containing protein [Hyalangium rubrum]|uniref:BON domain-containing protein n=1 Tax=Hyalangium rubrum TaxID=3103134 RepID=A0ABU5H4A0_9BACT|nr:BON domain-containing protein [Hyalangium sp. s54d21]MDY7228288.1 BON domain-containing protein [Hyalangium sp. s54d21]